MPIEWSQLEAIYRRELLDRTVPFWLRHGLDWQAGGIRTCLADDGTLLSSHKYVWSQLRAIWTFSALHRGIQARSEYLDAATHIYDFIKDRGHNAEGDWYFCLDGDGSPLFGGATSLYCAGFAIYGFIEYARASGHDEALSRARAIYDHIMARLRQPGSYATHPWPVPAGLKAHGAAMLFTSVFDQLGAVLDDEAITAEALHQAREVLDVFRQVETKRILEYVQLDNRPLATPPGRVVNPGHAIESMWFLIHLYQRVKDKTHLPACLEAIRWHLELGWDPAYGGLWQALDAEGSPWAATWDMKIWWPHTEAFYALLLAHSLCGEPWCLEWHQRIHDYAFRHFPVPEHGEWIQNLDRQGRKIAAVVALPVKDPFHLSRALILSLQLLRAGVGQTRANSVP